MASHVCGSTQGCTCEGLAACHRQGQGPKGAKGAKGVKGANAVEGVQTVGDERDDERGGAGNAN